MPTRDNPYFTTPLGEDIDAEFRNGIPEHEPEPKRQKLPTVPSFATKTIISFCGDELPVQEIKWDGTPNTSVKQTFELLSACDCCERHQSNRPNTIYGWKNTPSRKNIRPEACIDPSACKCECRHRMRFIARQF